MFNNDFGLRAMIIAFLLGNGSSLGVEHLLVKDDHNPAIEQSQPSHNGQNPNHDMEKTEIIDNVHNAINKFIPIMNEIYAKGKDCGNKVDVNAIIGSSVNESNDLMDNIRNSMTNIVNEFKKCKSTTKD